MNDTNTSEESASEVTPWGWGVVVLGVFSTFVISIFTFAIFNALASDTERMTLPRILSGVLPAWLGYGALALFVASRLPGGPSLQLGLRFEKQDLPKGLLIGVLGQVLAVLVYIPINLIWPGSTDGLSGPATELTDALSSWRWVIFGLFVGIISPFCEELFFRGITLRAISTRFGNWVGIVGSGLIFGIIHIEPIQTVALAALGMLLAWRAVRTGRIGESIVAHSTFNFITFFALLMK